MFSGDNAVCAAVGNRNLCQCAVGHHFVDEIQLCSVTRGIGEQCDYSYDCLVTSGNVNCAENTCSCLEGFHATRGDCTPDVEAINDPCLDTTDCTLAIPHSSCVSNKCQCNSGYFEDQTANNLCLTGIGGDCTNDDDCSNVEYSFCDGSRCGCVNTTIPNAGNTKCLAVATAHGGECEEDVQCHEALGQEGSSCLDGICACKDDYHFRSGSCREKRVLGEACEINSQCYLESEETDRVECRNGICQCGYIYTQTQDLDCKSGVSKLMVSFEFLAGALIWSLLERTMWN
ncbi:hypothetical protein L798_03559 [Zootermopsis nevadensis]|uniref:EB domain-containing protein n=2 Tax=Zootermopsis nevadensis TaxID=136037 RepID=A0A067QFY7_ZOONE|nr:hypothetical protein L798_03559 [Zootermopsis nevadensis]